jgi:hypothetical protein
MSAHGQSRYRRLEAHLRQLHLFKSRRQRVTRGKPVAERAACTIPTPIIARWTFAPSTAALRTDEAVRDRAENPWG